jgi:hypothetical protein
MELEWEGEGGKLSCNLVRETSSQRTGGRAAGDKTIYEKRERTTLIETMLNDFGRTHHNGAELQEDRPAG